jgi:hypothetical protein
VAAVLLRGLVSTFLFDVPALDPISGPQAQPDCRLAGSGLRGVAQKHTAGLKATALQQVQALHFTTRLEQGRPFAEHLPLGRALADYAGAKNREKLLALLFPLSRAADASALIRDLVDSGDIYHPLSWTSGEAYRQGCIVRNFEV